MGDRFYAQQEGKLGYSKTKVHDSKSSADKPKRRLKADICKHIASLVGLDRIESMDKMTIAGLEQLEKAIEKVKK